MSRCLQAVRSALSAGLVALALPCAAIGATSTQEGLARCAAIAAPDARLSCYDALAGRPPATTAVQAPAAATGGAAPAVATAAPATPPAASPADATAGFGLTPAQIHEKPAGPEAISAIIDSISEDRNRTVTVRLDNGQTWVLSEGEMRFRPGDRVTIKHGALGSFMMTTPSRHSYHVKRIQ